MNEKTVRFDFKHFESLPDSLRVKEAQAEASRLFPAGSLVEDFQSFFVASGAKCVRGNDNNKPYIFCTYKISNILSLGLVSTDWQVVSYLDSTQSRIEGVSVGRYITGL